MWPSPSGPVVGEPWQSLNELLAIIAVAANAPLASRASSAGPQIDCSAATRCSYSLARARNRRIVGQLPLRRSDLLLSNFLSYARRSRYYFLHHPEIYTINGLFLSRQDPNIFQIVQTDQNYPSTIPSRASCESNKYISVQFITHFPKDKIFSPKTTRTLLVSHLSCSFISKLMSFRQCHLSTRN